METSNILSQTQLQAFVDKLNLELPLGVEPMLDFVEEDITCLVIVKARNHVECYEINRVSGSFIRVYVQP